MIQDLFHLILMGVFVYKWGLGDDVNTTLNLKYVLFSALSLFIHISSRNAQMEIESSHIFHSNVFANEFCVCDSLSLFRGIRPRIFNTLKSVTHNKFHQFCFLLF